MSPHIWWYLSRSAGMVALGLALLSVTSGLTITGRLSTKKLRLPWSNDLHRYLSVLTIAFLFLHVATLALDSYAPFNLKDMLVPGASPWRPVAIALGICATYCLVVIDLTSRFRAKLSKRVWRSFHALSAVVYVTALMHAFSAGPDMSLSGIRYAVVAIVTLDVVLLARRIANARASAAKKKEAPPRQPRAGTTEAPAPAS